MKNSDHAKPVNAFTNLSDSEKKKLFLRTMSIVLRQETPIL